jgi:hypothetical protein
MEPANTAPRRAPGEILRELRKLLAPPGVKILSQARLAERLGYNEEYLQSFESGRRPMQPHFVDEMARLQDEARFPDTFARLVEELRAAVAALWAGVAQPPAASPDKVDPAATAGAALDGALAGKLEGKLDGLRVTLEASSARTEGRLDGLGGKLDRAEGTLGVLGSKLDTTSARMEGALGALAGKVETASARTEGQLHGLAAKVADTGDEVERTGAKVESTQAQVTQAEKKVTRKLDLTLRLLCANFGVGVIGLAAVLVLHCHRATNLLQPAPPGGTASVGGGEAARGSKDRCIDDPSPPCLRVVGAEASGQLDKKAPDENWLPSEPLDGQRPPPCDEGLGQEAISGGCWYGSDKVKPPCGRLYRKGDRCFVPVAADPKQPVGDDPRQAP